jgi:hypothetical protein
MYGSIVKSFWFLWLMLDIIHINITYFEIPLHRTGLSTSSYYICKWPPHHLGLGDSVGTLATTASNPPPCSLHLITVRARRGHNPSAGQGWQWRGLTCRASDQGRCRSCYGHRLLLGGEGIEGQGLGGVARASIHCLEAGGCRPPQIRYGRGRPLSWNSVTFPPLKRTISRNQDHYGVSLLR